jgi:hypothetical protein
MWAISTYSAYRSATEVNEQSFAPGIEQHQGVVIASGVTGYRADKLFGRVGLWV